jgi:hypothetical protein
MSLASGIYTFFCLLFSILLPPIGVIMRTGVCNKVGLQLRTVCRRPLIAVVQP